MNKKILALVALLILTPTLFSLAPLPSYAATMNGDYSSNFDNFAVGTANPFPWTYISITSTCTGTCASPSTAGAVSSTYYTSAPNSYSLADTWTCNSCASTTLGPQAILKTTLNATTTSVNATVYLSESTKSNTNCVSLATLKVNSSSSSIIQAISNPTNGQKFSEVLGVTPGTTFTVILNTTSAMDYSSCTSGASTTTNYWDSFSITGAAAYISSYNFELFNSTTAGPYWYDPSTYTGSSLTVQYPSSTNSSVSWANAPTTGLSLAAVKYANLYQAQLITLSVGSYYQRSIIPSKNPSATDAIYVDLPSSVVSYVVQVTQVGSNTFGPGAEIFIQQGTRNITSGYLSSASTFAVELVPGTYNILLINGEYVNSQSAAFPALGGTVYDYIFGSSVVFPGGSAFTQFWNAVASTKNLTSIVVSYQDNSSTTTKIFVELLNINSSGTFQLGNQTLTLTPGGGTQFAQVTFSASLYNFNVNDANTLWVSLYSWSTFGTNAPQGEKQVVGGSLFALDASDYFGSGALNLGNVLPGVSWLSLIALFVMIVMGGSFGYFNAKFGAVALGFTLMFFASVGWLPGGAGGKVMGISGAILLLVLTSYFLYAERGQ